MFNVQCILHPITITHFKNLSIMTIKIAISITGYSDGSKIARLYLNEKTVKIQMKQVKEIIEKAGLKLRTNFGYPEGAKFYKFYI